MTNQIDYNLLRALNAVIEFKSFAKGASSLGVTQSAISQRIKQLESSLGSPVLIRSPQLELTALGIELNEHFNSVKKLESGLAVKVPQFDSNSETLKIAVNSDSLETWWFDVTSKLCRDIGIKLDIQAVDQDVALSHMEQGLVSCCLCASDTPLPNADVSKVNTLRYRMFGAKEFYEQYFKGVDTITAIEAVPAVIYGKDDQLHDQYLANLGYKGMFPFHLVPSSTGIAKAIKNGLGYGLLTEEQVKNCGFGEELVPLFGGDWLEVDLYWHFWKNGSAQSHAFSEALINT